eukprot:SAG22_NODE_3956_length_1450_cov_1.547002_1_plen_483_part_11
MDGKLDELTGLPIGEGATGSEANSMTSGDGCCEFDKHNQSLTYATKNYTTSCPCPSVITGCFVAVLAPDDRHSCHKGPGTKILAGVDATQYDCTNAPITQFETMWAHIGCFVDSNDLSQARGALDISSLGIKEPGPDLLDTDGVCRPWHDPFGVHEGNVIAVGQFGAAANGPGSTNPATSTGMNSYGDPCEAQALADKKDTDTQDTQESVMIFRLQLIAAFVAVCVFFACSPSYLTVGILHCPFEGSRTALSQRSPRTLGFKTTNMTSPLCMFGILFLAMQLGYTSAQTCAAANVTCNRGSVIVQDASSVVGTNADLCCSCPDGTVQSYRDQNLVLTFTHADISRDENGSLIWPGRVPDGMIDITFRMERPPDPHVGGQQDEDGNPIYAEALMWSGDFTEPRFEDSPPQYPPGMYFTDEQFGQPGGTATMYADKKIAYGRMNTFFAVVTPMGVTQWMVLLAFRPGSTHGNYAYGMGTGANPAG